MRKYGRGQLITSIDELVKQRLIWIDIPSWTNHVRHIGFVDSWQLHTICMFMQSSLLYTVTSLPNRRLADYKKVVKRMSDYV